MKIRAEQVAALGQLSLETFVKRLLWVLPQRFPDAMEARALDPAGLEGLIHEGIARAKPYDVVAEGDVERFIECLLVLGYGFDDDANLPWAREILRRTDLDGEEKMDAIDEYRMFELKEPV